MTLKVLACSPDSQFLDEVSSWVSLQSDIEIDIENSQNEIDEKILTGNYSLLLFDNRDWDNPISQLIQQVNERHPSIRVVIFPAWNDLGFPDTTEYPNIHLLTWPVPKEILPSVIDQLFPQLSSQPSESSFPYELRDPLNEWITDTSRELVENINASPPAHIPLSPETYSEQPAKLEDEDNQASGWLKENEQPDTLSQEDTALLEPWGVSLTAETAPETTQQSDPSAPAQPSKRKSESSSLPYQCVLIPRDANHFLTSEIARQLSTWLPPLHQEYGCQVTALAVRPLYLSWSLILPPDACPGDVIQAIRQATSDRIFEQFPNLFAEDSNNFWADGYLLVSGEHTLPTSFLQAFLDRERSSAACIDANLATRKS